MPESRQYELVYVVAPDVGDDAVANLHTQVDEIIVARGGQIEKTDNWGRRRLAYEIGRHKEGTYVLELFTGPGELVHELGRRLKVADNVLRYLVVRVDEDLRKAERVRSRRQAQRQRRRAARGLAPTAAPSAATSESGGAATVPVAAGAPTGESAEPTHQAEVKE